MKMSTNRNKSARNQNALENNKTLNKVLLRVCKFGSFLQAKLNLVPEVRTHISKFPEEKYLSV